MVFCVLYEAGFNVFLDSNEELGFRPFSSNFRSVPRRIACLLPRIRSLMPIYRCFRMVFSPGTGNDGL